MSTSDSSSLVDRLEKRKRDLDRAQKQLDEYGETELERLQDVYTKFRGTLERYQEQVVGDEGDIQTIVEFQSQLADVMDDIPRDLLCRDTFEECDEYLQKKWFHDSDFEHVYEQLDPIADLLGRLDDRDDARRAYRNARRDLETRTRQCEQERAELERLAELTDADLDAPTERLREPIEAYNDAVREAFREFKRDESAREVVRFLARMEQFPLIAFESPPEDVIEYVLSHPPGTEPVPTLLEYAEYSRSKLEHYVADPDRLKHAIDGHRAYLLGLDGDPLTVSWPPPKADVLRFRCRELTTAVNRIAPDVVGTLRRVRALARETDYDRLRNAAVIRQELSDAERERLRSEDIEAELDAVRAECERLQRALTEFPER